MVSCRWFVFQSFPIESFPIKSRRGDSCLGRNPASMEPLKKIGGRRGHERFAAEHLVMLKHDPEIEVVRSAAPAWSTVGIAYTKPTWSSSMFKSGGANGSTLELLAEIVPPWSFSRLTINMRCGFRGGGSIPAEAFITIALTKLSSVQGTGSAWQRCSQKNGAPTIKNAGRFVRKSRRLIDRAADYMLHVDENTSAAPQHG